MTHLPARDVVGPVDAAIVDGPHLTRVELILAALCVIAGAAAIVVNAIGLAGWLA